MVTFYKSGWRTYNIAMELVVLVFLIEMRPNVKTKRVDGGRHIYSFEFEIGMDMHSCFCYVPGCCAISKFLRTTWIHIMRSAIYKLRR